MAEQVAVGEDELSADGADIGLPYRYAPRHAAGHRVLRKDLLRHLTEASLLKQLCIVRGPAGSGKTTLLTQWFEVAQQMDRPVAWLTVDAADRDLAHLLRGLALALQRAGCVRIAEGVRALAGQADSAGTAQLAQRLATICNRSGERPLIVIDQYECMDGEAIGQIVAGFLQHAASTRLVIASRVRPVIQLGSLRARDQLFEIGPSDLNLTPLETRAAFDEDVPELYTRRLHLETSGEAVAVGFARRVMDELPRDMVGAENWQEQLHEYYRAEVLDNLPEQLRDAMSRLVVVERFDLSLATALLGRHATAVIERLHHVEGLLLRHRGTQEFYFPEMLRRFLERRLAWMEDADHAGLHRRAALWFAQRGRHMEALRHAVAAGDREQASVLLERVGQTSLVTQQGVSEVHRMLASIGLARDADSPATLLSLAVIHAHEGDAEAAGACLDKAKRMLAGDGADDPAVGGPLILAEAFVAGFRERTSSAATAPALRRHLDDTPESDHDMRAQVHVLLSWDRFCHGDMGEAQRLIDAAGADYAETEGVYGCVFMHVHQALTRFWRNDLDQALAEISLGERMTRIFFPDDQRLRAMTGMLRAGLLFELGRPDTLTDFTALVGTVGAVESWSEIQIWSHLQAARAALAQGRGQEARGIASYGLEVAKRLESRRMDWHMRLMGLEIAIRAGEIGRARAMGTAMGLPDAAFLDGADGTFTWQEQGSGLLAGLRLADALDDDAQFTRLAAIARARIDALDVDRCRAQLEILLARRAQRQGDVAGAADHVAAARAACPHGLPAALFLEAADGLGSLLPDLSAWVVPAKLSASRGPVPLPAADERDPLTERERQIMLFMGEGHPNKVTAYRLGLSEATVKFHLRNIYRKLHAQNRTQALARYRNLADER
ncbi:LuxR C-terminal-related transcriptional regulator [Niveispirillum fermenti]|uniref:LuxR C-terminal-related transcriptional regulator n=1 Tax=Niveispirillum fermenti TaxID=1233113 RepID=UPI003A88CF57